MNRISRRHTFFRSQFNHRINPVTIIIIIIVLIFIGYFFLGNNEKPISHQTSDVKVSQQVPHPHKQVKLKSRNKRKLKLKSLPESRKLNLTKIKIILNHSYLNMYQKYKLINIFQKLGLNQQKRILKIINNSRNRLKTTQAELRILRQHLKHKEHYITSDLN